MKLTESIFGFWNSTEKTVKRFQMLRDVLAKDHARLELVICTLKNESIQSWCSSNVSELLDDNWQPPIGSLGIAFFRPSPLFLPQYGVMPLFSIGDIAVAYFGVIDNLSEIREKLIYYGYSFYTQNNMAETLSLLLHHYLEFDKLSQIDAMQKMMTKLKGHFALMALVTKGKWLMVGCRDYPLAMGRMMNETVYFGTDTKTLAQFTQSMSSVFGNTKQMIFCGTSPQSDLLSPDFISS
jgi:glutamine phosphoribosylpyrophosphate amidotransferase